MTSVIRIFPRHCKSWSIRWSPSFTPLLCRPPSPFCPTMTSFITETSDHEPDSLNRHCQEQFTLKASGGEKLTWGSACLMYVIGRLMKTQVFNLRSETTWSCSYRDYLAVVEDFGQILPLQFLSFCGGALQPCRWHEWWLFLPLFGEAVSFSCPEYGGQVMHAKQCVWVFCCQILERYSYSITIFARWLGRRGFSQGVRTRQESKST